MGSEPDPVRASLERALGSEYRILRLLGRGGMGAVYLAREESLERLVAVKVLSQERGLDEASRERFRREARTAARLTHPNIVPLHAFGEAEGMMYLVMGYVSGESLASRLRRDVRLGVAETRRIVADLADALDHAHRQGVVHRDVKPDNVLIDDESGRALLADFGVARALGGGGTMTQAGTVIGTPDFMSPEQAAGNPHVDGRSDLYSLGALAYALLAGRPPFDGDARAVLAKHLTQEPPPLGRLRRDVPEDLAAALMRCLAKDRDARWPDARAFREAIAPTGLDEDDLPEPLDALDGRAAMLLPALIVFFDALLYAWLTLDLGSSAPGFWRFRRTPGLLNALLLVLSGGILLYQIPWLASAARVSRRRGFGWRQVWGAFLRQPTSWHLFWYPRRFRRGGDVWDRLPRPFRLWRAAATLVAADLVLFAPMLLYMVNNPDVFGLRVLGRRLVGASGLVVAAFGPGVHGAALAVLVTLALVSLAACARHVLALRLDVYQRRRVTSILLSQPTARRSVWKRPENARLLLPPPSPAAALTEPRLPAEIALALARQAAVETGEARRVLEQAAGEARTLASELERLDAEIASLGVDADPAEAARLRQRLEALGTESADEADERRRMRRLLAEQAGLQAQIAERLDAARARRIECQEALRQLWRGARTDAAATATRTR